MVVKIMMIKVIGIEIGVEIGVRIVIMIGVRIRMMMMMIKIKIEIIKFINVIVGLVSITPGHVKLD